MSDFDEMLRAGAISPGSTPRVESRRAPVSKRQPLPSTTTAGETTHTSRPAVLQGGVSRFAPRVADGRVLVLHPEPGIGEVVKAVLAPTIRAVVATDASVLDAGFAEFSAVIVGAPLWDFARVVALPLPLIVLATPTSVDRVREVLGDRDADVVLMPFERDDLLERVRAARMLPRVEP